MATISVPKKIEKEIKKISKKLGISQEDFLINALLYYFQRLEKEADLKREFEFWEKASNEDFLKFEKFI